MEKFIDTQRDIQFFNNKRKILLEVHWTFHNLFFSLPFNICDEKDLIKLKIKGLTVLNPLTEDMILILCLHNASHRWSRLLWLCDIVELIKSKRNIDWRLIIRKADDLGIKRILSINLHLAKDLLDLNLPDYVLDNLQKPSSIKFFNKLKCSLFSEFNNRTLFYELEMSLSLREKKKDGIKDAIKGLSHPTVYEWKNCNIPVHFWRFYNFYRPLNLILRYDWK